MPPLVKKASGVEGRISYPEIGALVGYFTNWQLWVEKGDDYNFRGHCGFVNRKIMALGEEQTGPIQIVIDLGRDKRYRLVQNNGGKLELEGDTLVMDGVTLVNHEGR